LVNGGLTLCYVRTTIVQNFIKLTEYFIKGEYDDLIKKYNIGHKTLFGQYDESKDINKFINDLAKHQLKYLSFEKIDPSILFFHEGDRPLLSFITNKGKSDQEYKDLLAIKNSQFYIRTHGCFLIISIIKKNNFLKN